MSSSTDTNATRCDNTPCNGGRAWLTDESDALDSTKKFCSADCADEWVAKQGDEDCDVVAEDDGSLHVVPVSGLDEGPKIADYDAVSLFPSAMGELDEGMKKAMKLMLASGYGKPWGKQ